MLIAGVALAGCGGDDEEREDLVWANEPTLIRAPTGGADRVVVGEIRNDGADTLELAADQIRVRDAAGAALRSEGRYVATYVHGLYGADVPTDELPESERPRLGLTVLLSPDETTPVYAAFRDRAGKPPLVLDTGHASLPIPSELTER